MIVRNSLIVKRLWLDFRITLDIIFGDSAKIFRTCQVWELRTKHLCWLAKKTKTVGVEHYME